MRFAVISFPGSNCDLDMYYAIKNILGEPVDMVPSRQQDLSKYDGVMIPGGFSYGDYLRSGAIARFAPAMKDVQKMAKAGKPVLGVCNGFQILTEAGLLPGTLQENIHTKFISAWESIKVANNHTMFTNQYQPGQILRIPIAHNEGNYYCEDATLKRLKEHHQIVFTYQNNPNGSRADIAGITNRQGNVLGMMPHPERAVEKILGSVDGLNVFKSILANFKATAKQSV